MQADPYDMLGVSRDASSADIRRAYQALALRLHPDKQAEAAAEADPSSTSTSTSGGGAALTFQQLQSAWEILRDEANREAYDKSYRLGEQAAEAHLAEVDLDDMEYDEAGACFSWPCRCSSRFIVRECQLEEQLDTFECDTCALKIRVLYDFVADDEEVEQQQQEAEEEAGPEPEPAA